MTWMVNMVEMVNMEWMPFFLKHVPIYTLMYLGMSQKHKKMVTVVALGNRKRGMEKRFIF